MSGRHPSRVALAVFDCFIADNDALRGDLVEEFLAGRSQFWLWRQVIGAVVYRPWPPSISFRQLSFGILAAAIVVLMAFEVVFFTNAIARLVFGPPLQDIRGYAYLAPLWFHATPAPPVQPTPVWVWLGAIAAIASSLPIGWWIGRVREHHRVQALAAFSLSLALCAAANLQLSLPAQFATSTFFLVGLLAAGTLESTADAQPSDGASLDTKARKQHQV